MARQALRARRAGVAGALLAAFALLFALLGAEAAGGKAVAPTAQATVTHSYPVTLITGDKVVLTTLSNGKQSVTVARTGTATNSTFSGSYHALRQNGDIYVWPVEVGPYVGTLLSQELFNV